MIALRRQSHFQICLVLIAASLTLGVESEVHAQGKPKPSDRVVVLHAHADAALRDVAADIEDHLAEGVAKSRKVAIMEEVPELGDVPPHPETEAEARTIAEIHRAQYLIAAHLSSAEEERVRLVVRVASVEQTRYDTITVRVDRNRLREAVVALVPLMLRAEGLGADGNTLVTEIDRRMGRWNVEVDPSEDPTAVPPKPESETPASPEPADNSGPKQTDGDVTTAGMPAENLGPLSLGVGLAVRPLLASEGSGGVLAGPVAQGRFRIIEELSVHANLGIMWGAASAMEVTVGAAAMPLQLPSLGIGIGASVEVGTYLSFSGSRDPGLLLRATPALHWAVSEALGLDVGVLELGWISGADALTLGGHVRIRYSF